MGWKSILPQTPPFVNSYSLSQFQGSSTPEFQLKDGFPLAKLTSGPLNLAQLQIRAQDPNQRTSYVEQVSFGPEFELGNNTALDVSYVGNFARKMNRLRNGNQGVFTGTFDSKGNPVVVFPYANLNDSAGNHAFLELATNDGNSNYNALLVSLKRRFAHGMAYGVSYTWSHNISDFVDNLTGGGFPQNAFNYAAERGDSMFDVRHRFVGYLTYELPVGRGKRYLGDGGIASYILGGWQANTIFTKQSGATIELFAPDSSLSGGTHTSRPNCIGNGRAGASDNPRTGLWLNSTAFALPGLGQFGHCGGG